MIFLGPVVEEKAPREKREMEAVACAQRGRAEQSPSASLPLCIDLFLPQASG